MKTPNFKCLTQCSVYVTFCHFFLSIITEIVFRWNLPCWWAFVSLTSKLCQLISRNNVILCHFHSLRGLHCRMDPVSAWSPQWNWGTVHSVLWRSLSLKGKFSCHKSPTMEWHLKLLDITVEISWIQCVAQTIPLGNSWREDFSGFRAKHNGLWNVHARVSESEAVHRGDVQHRKM